jgi:hypothetical protein
MASRQSLFARLMVGVASATESGVPSFPIARVITAVARSSVNAKPNFANVTGALRLPQSETCAVEVVKTFDDLAFAELEKRNVIATVDRSVC